MVEIECVMDRKLSVLLLWVVQINAYVYLK